MHFFRRRKKYRPTYGCLWASEFILLLRFYTQEDRMHGAASLLRFLKSYSEQFYLRDTINTTVDLSSAFAEAEFIEPGIIPGMLNAANVDTLLNLKHPVYASIGYFDQIQPGRYVIECAFGLGVDERFTDGSTEVGPDKEDLYDFCFECAAAVHREANPELILFGHDCHTSPFAIEQVPTERFDDPDLRAYFPKTSPPEALKDQRMIFIREKNGFGEFYPVK